MSHFQLNTGRGCQPHALDVSYASNPSQTNFIVPGTSVSPNGVAAGPGCGNEAGFAISYGSGYPSITSPIVSPYPGIGTIRAFDTSPCPGGDNICNAAGTARVPTSNGVLLDWTNGSSIDSATWGAKVRAHFYQKDLSTGTHPGVHGIFGDGFTWSEPYGTDDHEGTDTQMDDGAIRNITVLHNLLPNINVGGNGAGLACGFGDTYAGSVPGAECSGAGDTTLFENSAAYTNTHNPTRLDDKIAEIGRWLNSPANDGKPKRAMINTCGLSPCGQPLGHVATAQDQRLGLAFATIAGAYFWITNGSGWNTSAIPGTASGTNFAIPEMGDTTSYPRGWLGLPTGGPVKIASGEWKRSFTNGTVYVNATLSAWSVDGRTVPAQDGLFVKS
jgi:hypothetical protein